MKINKKIIYFATSIALLLIIFDQSRSIYKIDDEHYITVWKRLGGRCIIVLGKYYFPLIPENYINTETGNRVFILYNKLDNFDFVISSYHDRKIEVVGYENYKLYVPEEYGLFKQKYYTAKDELKSALTFFYIDIKEKTVFKGKT